MCDHCRTIEAFANSLAALKDDPVFLAESPGVVLFGQVMQAVITFSKKNAKPAIEMVRATGCSQETRSDAIMLATQLRGVLDKAIQVLVTAKQEMGDNDAVEVTLGGIGEVIGSLLKQVAGQGDTASEKADPDFMEQLRRDIERAEGRKSGPDKS